MQYGMPTLIENQSLAENISLCKELGLKFIELNMNFPEYQINQLENWEKFYDLAEKSGIYYTIHLDENLNIADFNPLVREACETWIGDADIKIAVENTDGFREYEKRAIEYLLDSPYFVLTWDIGHSKAVKEIDTPFLLEHRDALKHFHIHDGKENPPKNHLALGDGEIDLVERLEMARQCNARCVLETKTIEALRTSVQWMSSCLKNRN